ELEAGRNPAFVFWDGYLSWLRHSLRPRYEAARLSPHTVYRGRRRNIKSAAIRVSPGQIRRLFRQGDCTQVHALRAPYPDSFRSSHEQIALRVHFDSVRNAVPFAAGFLAEDAAVA